MLALQEVTPRTAIKRIETISSKPAEITIIYERHGKSWQNKFLKEKDKKISKSHRRYLVPDKDIPLTPLGFAQAEEGGESIIEAHPDLIKLPSENIICITSEMERSKATAKAFLGKLIEKRLTGEKFKYKPNSEFYIGIWDSSPLLNELEIGLAGYSNAYEELKDLHNRFVRRRNDSPERLLNEPPVYLPLTRTQEDLAKKLGKTSSIDKYGETLNQLEERLLKYNEKLYVYLKELAEEKKGQKIYVLFFGHGVAMAVQHFLFTNPGKRLKDLTPSQISSLINPNDDMALLNCTRREYDFDLENRSAVFKGNIKNDDNKVKRRLSGNLVFPEPSISTSHLKEKPIQAKRVVDEKMVITEQDKSGEIHFFAENKRRGRPTYDILFTEPKSVQYEYWKQFILALRGSYSIPFRNANEYQKEDDLFSGVTAVGNFLPYSSAKPLKVIQPQFTLRDTDSTIKSGNFRKASERSSYQTQRERYNRFEEVYNRTDNFYFYYDVFRLMEVYLRRYEPDYQYDFEAVDRKEPFHGYTIYIDGSGYTLEEQIDQLRAGMQAHHAAYSAVLSDIHDALQTQYADLPFDKNLLPTLLNPAYNIYVHFSANSIRAEHLAVDIEPLFFLLGDSTEKSEKENQIQIPQAQMKENNNIIRRYIKRKNHQLEEREKYLGNPDSIEKTRVAVEELKTVFSEFFLHPYFRNSMKFIDNILPDNAYKKSLPVKLKSITLRDDKGFIVCSTYESEKYPEGIHYNVAIEGLSQADTLKTGENEDKNSVRTQYSFTIDRETGNVINSQIFENFICPLAISKKIIYPLYESSNDGYSPKVIGEQEVKELTERLKKILNGKNNF